jgi:pimeloyl-ACP methyl ester carboxylesterase
MQCLVDGDAVHVDDSEPTAIAGVGARSVIVLLHGAANDHRVWLPVTAGLAQAGYVVLAPDLPGHGGSAGALCTDVAHMAAWLLKLLDACGLERCALAGHSMGSLVALHAAGLAPGRVSQLALVGTAWPMRVAPALLDLAQHQPDVALRQMALWSHKETPGRTQVSLSPLVGGAARSDVPGGTRKQQDDQPLQPELVQQTLALMQSVQAGNTRGNVLATDLAACNAYADALAMAAQVRAPVAFILGEHDRMTPPKATQRLREALPQARVTHLDAGHALMSEAPGDVVQALVALPAQAAPQP